ncbi:hypothetical protein FRC07_009360, partial [Ceratobasidium sp. 392]
SVNALETMLVRLYLESPLVGGMLQDEGVASNLGEIGMSALGDAELGIPGDSRIDIPAVHQDAQLHLPPHLHH